jgi:poly(hydroxyalkanoate) depolymerase family esterase
MTATLTSPMSEATRLTREGRLAEATQLLQRALRGGAHMGDAPPAPGTATERPTRAPRIIDVDPETGDVSSPESPEPTRPSAGPAARAWLPDRPALRDMLGRPGLGRRSRDERPLPDGASFLTHTFTNHAGSRGYRLYAPGTRNVASLPLIVMLHGCTQSPEDFAAGTRMNMLAETHGCLIAYPGQTQAANAQRCWNWFSPGDQQRDQGEPALIAGITRQVMRDHRVDDRRVYVAGLSAGGAAAAIMGVAYPDLYAAIGVHSGLACGAARDMPSAFAAMRHGGGAATAPSDGNRRPVPAIVFHADRDGTVHPRNGDQVIAQSAPSGGLRVEVQRGQIPGGHAYSRSVHRDAGGKAMLEQWLVHGGGHAWSGGSTEGSYTDPRGPDASREMMRFFLEHALEGDNR